jgi:hypothetical protein
MCFSSQFISSPTFLAAAAAAVCGAASLTGSRVHPSARIPHQRTRRFAPSPHERGTKKGGKEEIMKFENASNNIVQISVTM